MKKIWTMRIVPPGCKIARSEFVLITGDTLTVEVEARGQTDHYYYKATEDITVRIAHVEETFE